jgi:DNA invertase Pin-like site-specific DNA recombinase
VRLAFYARVSMEEQLEGYSIDAQLRAGQELASRMGAELVPYVREGKPARVEVIQRLLSGQAPRALRGGDKSGRRQRACQV